jgi:hypothetical protein
MQAPMNFPGPQMAGGMQGANRPMNQNGAGNHPVHFTSTYTGYLLVRFC